MREVHVRRLGEDLSLIQYHQHPAVRLVEAANELGETRGCRGVAAAELRLKTTLRHARHLCRCLDALDRTFERLREFAKAGGLERPSKRSQKNGRRLAPSIPYIQVSADVSRLPPTST